MSVSAIDTPSDLGWKSFVAVRRSDGRKITGTHRSPEDFVEVLRRRRHSKAEVYDVSIIQARGERFLRPVTITPLA